MKTSDEGRPAPWVALAVMLALAVGLMAMPRRVRDPMRNATATVLRPGQSVTRRGVEGSQYAVAWFRANGQAADEIARLKGLVAKLQDQNRDLALQVAQLEQDRSDGTATLAAAGGAALFRPELLKATVLGEEATGILRERRIVGVGTRAGVEEGALVLDSLGPMLDQGASEGVAEGQLVLDGWAVAGRVVQTGPWTSVVQLVTDAEYRGDLVQIAHRDGESLHFGPQGVLSGTGESLCRVETIDATEPVAVGDLVYSAGHEGLLPKPLLYGEVVRAEREPGAPYWSIWVHPAVESDKLNRVAVLRPELNPVRIADQPADTTRR